MSAEPCRTTSQSEVVQATTPFRSSLVELWPAFLLKSSLVMVLIPSLWMELSQQVPTPPLSSSQVEQVLTQSPSVVMLQRVETLSEPLSSALSQIRILLPLMSSTSTPRLAGLPPLRCTSTSTTRQQLMLLQT